MSLRLFFGTVREFSFDKKIVIPLKIGRKFVIPAPLHIEEKFLKWQSPKSFTKQSFCKYQKKFWKVNNKKVDTLYVYQCLRTLLKTLEILSFPGSECVTFQTVYLTIFVRKRIGLSNFFKKESFKDNKGFTCENSYLYKQLRLRPLLACCSKDWDDSNMLIKQVILVNFNSTIYVFLSNQRLCL